MTENLKILDLNKATEMFGSEAMTKKFVGRFEVRTLDPDLDKIAVAWKAKNYPDLKSLSHKLKGSSG